MKILMGMGNKALKAGKTARKMQTSQALKTVQPKKLKTVAPSRKLLTPQKPQMVKALKAAKPAIGTKLKTTVPMLKKPAKKRTLLNYF